MGWRGAGKVSGMEGRGVGGSSEQPQVVSGTSKAEASTQGAGGGNGGVGKWE